MADRRLSNTFGKVLKEPKGVEDVLPKLLPFISTTFQSIDKLLDQCGKSKQERLEEGTYLSDQIRELLLSRLKKHETDKEEHERKMLELIEKYRQDVIGYWQELEIPEEDRQSPLDLWLNGTDETFAEGLSLVQKYRAAQSKAEELAGEIRRLKETVPVLLPKICHLWEELSVSKSDRDPLWKVLNVEDNEEKRAAFLQQCISNPTATTTHTFPLKAIEACEIEYDRLVELRTTKLKSLIQEKRDRLAFLWKELHFGESQMKECTAAYTDEVSDDVLNELNTEVNKLEVLLTHMGPLLKLIVRREWIKSEMKVFENSASDPKRLFRNSARLLAEEKFRKIVSKEFPVLTEQLSVKLVDWERDQNTVFLYEGVSYLETMNTETDRPNFELLHLKLLTDPKGTDPNKKPSSPSLSKITITTKTSPSPSSSTPSPKPSPSKSSTSSSSRSPSSSSLKLPTSKSPSPSASLSKLSRSVSSPVLVTKKLPAVSPSKPTPTTPSSSTSFSPTAHSLQNGNGTTGKSPSSSGSSGSLIKRTPPKSKTTASSTGKTSK